MYPAKRRNESRLLVMERRSGKISGSLFANLPDFLREGDVLVINETKVIPARLIGENRKGRRVEFLIVETSAEGKTRGLVKGLKKLRMGDVINFEGGLEGEFEGREGEMGIFRFNLRGKALEEWIERYGHVPLPPYIDRPDEPEDRANYQTVYALKKGSCAAPTAGLHFTQSLLDNLKAEGIGIEKICLHVGPGTFRPITSEDISKHRLDAEQADVPDETYRKLMSVKAAGGRVVAVGTTTVRALESAALKGGGFSGKTDLFINPGFNFKMTDVLITNFHLPRSSLLVLVCAFAGREKVMRAYEEAVAQEYRFYSYGDAMLII